MFVKNLTKSTLEFRKNGRVLVLNPGVNLVDSLIWDIQDLKKTYGPTILTFFNEEKAEENAPKPVEAPVEGEEKATELVEGEGDVLKGEGEEVATTENPQPDNIPVIEMDDAPVAEEKAVAKNTKATKAPKTTGKKNK
jgi:hypothetical protein